MLDRTFPYFRPHRPDLFYGLSLCLMIAALLLRFADALWSGSRRRLNDSRPNFPPKSRRIVFFEALAAPEKLCFNSFVAGANHRGVVFEC